MLDTKTFPKEIDTLVIAGKHDIALLRHFLQSQKIFSNLGGQIHLFIWKSEKYLLDQIQLSETIRIWYKDDIPEMVEDDFRNQMFIKLVADRFIKTEWFWIADADYLICDDLMPSDFFNSDGRPYWFYRNWDGGVPEKRWRSGAEKYMKSSVPYLFLDEPQFLMSTKILRDFGEKFDLKGALHDEPMPADCLVYGAFAFANHPEAYDWIDMNGPEKDRALCYKVNQRPPTYCELDDNVSLFNLPSKKYYIFWSYWDQAERKMQQFLKDAAGRHVPPLEIITDETPLYVNVEVDRLAAGHFEDIDGVYSDGWVHQTMRFGLYNDECEAIYLGLEAPAIGASGMLNLSVVATCNEQYFPATLAPGMNEIRIDLHRATENRISLQFSVGLAEPGGQRTLFARLVSVRFKSVQ